MPTPPPDRPRRRWRIRLRALMILVLIVGVPLGWVARRARRARIQKQAVAAIFARGGGVRYDHDVRDEERAPRPPGSPAPEPPGPAWLRRLVGDEPFQEVDFVALPQPATAADLAAVAQFDRLRSLILEDVTGVGDGLHQLDHLDHLTELNIVGPGLTDAHLAPIGRRLGLTLLWLDNTELTDAGLDALRPLTRLKKLDLNHSPGITDAGVARLVAGLPDLEYLELNGDRVGDPAVAAAARLPKLKNLVLDGTRVTDAGLAALGSARGLEVLHLDDTAVTDAGLAHLAPLARMQRLYLNRTRITGAGLAHLAGLTDLEHLQFRSVPMGDADLPSLARLAKLRVLDLSEVPITDAGTPHLAKLVGLQLLSLRGTKVTDAGLAPLAALKKLTSLRIIDTAVTDEGEAEVRRLLPGLRSSTRGLPEPLRDSSAVAAGNRAATAGPGAGVAVGGGGAVLPGVAGKGGAVGDSSGKQSAVLDRLRDKSRPVVVLGPSPEDERVVRQRHAWVGALPEAGIKDRDLVVVEAFEAGQGTIAGAPVAAGEAQELREALGVAAGAFAVVLVGRDGGAKERWDAPVSAHEIFGKVDAMPMRQREVEEKGGGSK